MSKSNQSQVVAHDHVTIIWIAIITLIFTMSLPRLVSPPPDARMPLSFEEREAQARLKMHLLMARMRTALRYVMNPDHDLIPKWKVYLKDELVISFFFFFSS